MDRYAEGEDAAFAALYDELAPRLLAFIRSMVRSHIAAEDIVQQTFLQLHEARATFARGGRVEPWAYTIARRVAIDWSRKRTRWRENDAVDASDANLPAPNTSPEEQAYARQLDHVITQELERVPTSLRDAFVMLRLEGFSVEETATVLDLTPGSAKVRAHRAGALLRVRLLQFFGGGST